MGAKNILRVSLRSLKQWLNEEEKASVPGITSVPFDNTYAWLRPSFEKLKQNPVSAKRPQYIWGMLQGIALAKVLGIDRVSVIELGVAGGAGVLAMEHIAESIEEMLSIKIDIYGFDNETGIPKSQDYRDLPNIWLDGQFPMDRSLLEKSLRRTSLKLSLVESTIPAFLKSSPAPMAFVSFDLDLYSSTRDALRLFEAENDLLLPRVLCYFDNIIGLTYSDYNGERLAIAEFNAKHPMKKLSPLYGLKYFVPSHYVNSGWPELFYFLHIFNHPRYNEPDELRKPMIIDLEGKITGYTLAKDHEKRTGHGLRSY